VEKNVSTQEREGYGGDKRWVAHVRLRILIAEKLGNAVGFHQRLNTRAKGMVEKWYVVSSLWLPLSRLGIRELAKCRRHDRPAPPR
jgi:uncharacterized membrane protein YecN with MAPEG domain